MKKKVLRFTIFALVAVIFVFLIILVTRKKPVTEKEEALPCRQLSFKNLLTEIL